MFNSKPLRFSLLCVSSAHGVFSDLVGAALPYLYLFPWFQAREWRIR